MKRIGKILAAVIIFASLLACSRLHAFACTGIYVGKDASSDGTYIIARSSDNQAVWGNHITVVESSDVPGRQMPVDMDGTVMAILPDHTYKYVATPFFTSTMVANDVANDASACVNECGVSITMAVTAFANDVSLAADPYVENGLTENTADDLILCQSSSAREAVEVLLKLIDEYGNSESNIALITDQNEAWYVEMYTGHQYAAVRLPDDCVSVFGNEFTMEYLSDYEESIVSEGLESLAKENGFAVYGRNNELNLFDTYSGDGMTLPYCHMRTWIGHQVLAPSEYKADYSATERYPLCFKPDQKVSMADVTALIRNRYEGTKYNPDETGRIDMRVIGTDTAMSVHALQVYPNLPTEMSALIWESTGPAIYGIFVPVSNAALSVSDAYGKDQGADEQNHFDTENYPYYAFKELSTLCVERDDYIVYGQPVRAYWNEAEGKMYATMPIVLQNAAQMKDKNVAAEYITQYCNSVQEKAFADAKQLVNDVLWEESKNSNTMKTGRNPETGERWDKERVLDPMAITLDATAYGMIPEIQAATAGNGNGTVSSGDAGGGRMFVPLVIFAVIAVFAGIVLAVMKKTETKDPK